MIYRGLFITAALATDSLLAAQLRGPRQPTAELTRGAVPVGVLPGVSPRPATRMPGD